MELEEMKAGWEKVSEQIDQQLKINTKLIHKMIRQQYRSQFNKIAYPEMLGSLVCFLMAAWLLWKFDRLDTAVLRVCGVLSALLLIALPVLSLQSLQGFGLVEIGTASYADTVRAFAVLRKRFIRLQRLNMVLTTPFMVVFAPTIIRLMTGKDITGELRFWLVVIPLCVVLQILLSRWVFRHYDRSMKEAGGLLEDLR